MGTKRTIARTGNIYVGLGKSDGAPVFIVLLRKGPEGIRHLLLLHVQFNRSLTTGEKRQVLGDRYNDIRNLVNEFNLTWDDSYLDLLPIERLLGESVEFIATKIRKSIEDH